MNGKCKITSAHVRLTAVLEGVSLGNNSVDSSGGDMSCMISRECGYSALEHLAMSLCLGEDDFMAMLTVYFDDSGTHEQSEIAVAACYVSDVRRWRDFESAWLSILAEAGIAEHGFHMADFVAHAKPYDTWPADKREKVFRALLSVINKYAFEGAIAAVVKADYDKLVPKKLREKLGAYHYTFAVQSCLAQIEYWRKVRSDEQPMQYVFDRMSHGKHEIINLFDDIEKRKTAVAFGLEPNGYAFQNRKYIVQLQAADILAWEANKYMKHFQFTGREARKSFQSLVSSVPILAKFFDKSTLPGFIADVTAKYEGVGWNGPLGGFL